MESTAYIEIPAYGFTYTFGGVLSVDHELSLKISTDSDSASGTDYVNGARNQPDKVTLKVMESDVGHAHGRAAQMIQALESVKSSRSLCNVITAGITYTDMLLSELHITEDETSQSGWTGTLTFTQYIPPAAKEKEEDNSSVPTNTGSAGPVQTVQGASPLMQMLLRAGINS